MKTKLLLTVLVVCTIYSNPIFSQKNYTDSIQAIRNAKNTNFTTPGKTPLNADQIKEFKGLPYFAIDSNGKPKAIFRAANPKVEVSLDATDGTKIKLIKYGTVSFTYI